MIEILSRLGHGEVKPLWGEDLQQTGENSFEGQSGAGLSS